MNPVYSTFVYVVWFISTYYVVLFITLMIMRRADLRSYPSPLAKKPLVSIIVPAFNEADSIADTISSLRTITYRNYEVIVVNDGSSDKTARVVRTAIRGDSRFRLIDRVENKGKAASLNEGIRSAKGEFIACMDADSMVEPGILEKVLPLFSRPKVGAVSVSVEVRNPKGLLGKLVQLEYIIGLSLLLRVLALVNGVFVTPGPFSVYRASVVRKIGGFSEDNFTEDLEIAYRIHKAGYEIDMCVDAVVRTLIPEGFNELYVQRRRWYGGAFQTWGKHRSMLLNPRYGAFSFFATYTSTLVILGMVLFMTTLFLLLRNVVKGLWNLQYSQLDILARLSEFRIDPLLMGGLHLVAITSIAFVFLLSIVSLIVMRRKMVLHKVGLLAFPLMFFLYQLYWFRAAAFAVTGKGIKWR